MSDRRTGREYWRSFEQMAGSDEAVKHLEGEFTGYDPKEIASMPRRRFLKLSAASMAVAGLTATGCRRWPKEHLVPSTAGMRDQIPGIPEFYATAIERNGVADSLLVTSADGRPIKIEGNPLHPMYTTWRKEDGSPRLAAADALAQASILEMYDPSRGRSVLRVDQTKQPAAVEISTWDAFFKAFEAASAGGAGVAVLSEASSSLTYADLKARFTRQFPQAMWVDYEPLTRDNEVAAGQAAFGRPVRALYRLTQADVIVSLDSDLFGTHPARIRHSNDWAQGRLSADNPQQRKMNRMYVAESAMTITGSVADHRLPIKPSQIASLTLALAAALKVPGATAPELSEAGKKWVAAAAADLQAAGKRGVVAVGLHTSPPVQALAYSINHALGNVGAAVTFHELPGASQQIAGLRSLCDRMDQVQTLLIIGGNPVYDAPADLDFASKLRRVPNKAHLSLYPNETSRACNWHLPRSHSLECWGDARTWDGSVTLQQPLILPLFDTRSPIEVLATILKDEATDGQTLVRRVVSAQLPAAASEDGWRTSLHNGFVENSKLPAIHVSAPAAAGLSPSQASDSIELRFLPSNVFDGRHANNGWLQELPDPITKLVWDNAALMNKTDADALGVRQGDMIQIKVGGMSLDVPAFILWGQPKGVIGLPLGYGRTAAGPIGGDTTSGSEVTEPVGFDTYRIRRSDGMHAAIAGVSITRTGNTHDLVSTQDYQALDAVGQKGYVDRVGGKGGSGRIVRDAALATYIEQPDFVDHVVHRLPLLQLWDAPYGQKTDDKTDPQAFNVPHAWGMTLDMNTCIGCNACVVACQSENNIPIVGKQMVRMNREMHWIRIDRYFKPATNENREITDYENVDVVFQPMTCVHCETAPCEQVCPVAATVHDTEGLNTMVYNRCIGTRYCSNNCPYKVRRFNYMDWHSRNPRADGPLGLLNSAWLGIPDTQQQESIAQVRRMVYNPDVTVRMRGVMEKCTYCTQRIKSATIARKNAWAQGKIPHEPKPNGRPSFAIDDFEVVTACQQACPTQAITFGDLMDKTSTVRKNQTLSRTYAVLEDLNTRPRGKHMAKLRNPSNALASATDQRPAEAQGAHKEPGM